MSWNQGDLINRNSLNNKTVDIAKKLLVGNNLRQLPVGAQSATVEISIINDSGADRLRGDVLAIKDATVYDDPFVYVEGEQTTHEKFHKSGILLEDVDDGDVGRLLIYGLAYARINVTDATHKFAKLVDSSYELESTNNETGFVILGIEADSVPTPPSTDSYLVLVRSPNDFAYNQLKFVSAKTVSGREVLQCKTIDGTTDLDISVEPASGINEDDWEGKTIDGITYTKISLTSRDADDGTTNWTENLFITYQADDIINVIPNDLDTDASNPIPYRESGSNKVWVKSC